MSSAKGNTIMHELKETIDKPYEKWTVKELQILLKSRNIKPYGKKDDLIDRVRRSDAGEKFKKGNIKPHERTSFRGSMKTSQKISVISTDKNISYLEVIPLDLLVIVASDLTLKNMYDLCQWSPRIKERLCDNDEFWIRLYKLTRKGRVPTDVKIRYSSMMDKYLYYYKSGEYSNGIFEMARQGFFNEIKDLREQAGNKISSDELSKALINAELNPKIIGYLISQGANDRNDYALDSAAQEGNMDIVKQLMESRTNTGSLRNIIEKTARSGHLDIIKYLETFEPPDPNNILLGAIQGDHVNIVDYALKRGAIVRNIFNVDDKYILPKSIKMIERLVESGAQHPENILFYWPSWGLSGYMEENQQIFIYVLENYGRDYGRILKRMIHNNSPLLAKIMLEKYRDKLTQEDLNETLIEATRLMELGKINLLLENGANNYDEALASMVEGRGSIDDIKASILRHKRLKMRH